MTSLVCSAKCWCVCVVVTERYGYCRREHASAGRR